MVRYSFIAIDGSAWWEQDDGSYLIEMPSGSRWRYAGGQMIYQRTFPIGAALCGLAGLFLLLISASPAAAVFTAIEAWKWLR